LFSHLNKIIQVNYVTFFVFKGCGEDEVDTKQDCICEPDIIGDVGLRCLAEGFMHFSEIMAVVTIFLIEIIPVYDFFADCVLSMIF